jgi:hypothetical protein
VNTRERLTVGIGIGIGIALLATLVLMLLLEAQSKVQVDCMDPTERERIRDIVLTGIDNGLKEQIQHLFETWMKDISDQPRRAMVGTNNAVNAHVRARKQAIEWNPPMC